MGTGMAFPWEVIRSANLASGSIVEDLKLGLDLAQTESPPLFCPSASVTSHFPLSVEGAKSQRKRWEEGHIRMILTTAPRFIYRAVVRKDLNLFTLALDLAIPPLSLLVILLAGMVSIAGLAVLLGFSSAALVISATSFTATVASVFSIWLKYGRDVLPPSAMLSIASHVFEKFPLYRHLFSANAASRWNRTDRKKSE
jgi:cellulose synthase/poly-beta-1,6-N-acetylglucosamine synthase-like glycosyltransferase